MDEPHAVHVGGHSLFRSAQRVCLLLCGCPCGHTSSRMLAMCAEDTAAMPLSCPLAPKMCSSSMYLAWRDCVQASNATVPTNKTAHMHGRLVRSTACHQRGVPFAHVGWDQRAACVARLRLTDPGVVLCCAAVALSKGYIQSSCPGNPALNGIGEIPP